MSKIDKKKQKGEATRKELIASTIASLDKLGYAETSINRVLEGVSVSRGALMHHFPTKEDLVIGTIDFLLSRILRHYQQQSHNPAPFANLTATSQSLGGALVHYWRNIIDTPEGRAFSEIIMATRTDAALRERISTQLLSWNDELNDFFLPQGLSEEQAEKMRLTLTIWRAFIRGLILQQQFEKTPQDLEKIIAHFAEIIEPHLTVPAPAEAK